MSKSARAAYMHLQQLAEQRRPAKPAPTVHKPGYEPPVPPTEPDHYRGMGICLNCFADWTDEQGVCGTCQTQTRTRSYSKHVRRPTRYNY